jgi:hypothetical protein
VRLISYVRLTSVVRTIDEYRAMQPVTFAVKFNVVDGGVRCVQYSLKGLGVRRDCEDSSARCDDLIVGSGDSEMKYDGYLRQYHRWITT